MDCRALSECDPRGEVRGAAEPVDAQPTARWQRCPAQRRVTDDPCAQQRCRMLVIKAGRHRIAAYAYRTTANCA